MDSPLTSKEGAVKSKIRGGQYYPQVGRNTVTRSEEDDVANHDVSRGKKHLFSITNDGRFLSNKRLDRLHNPASIPVYQGIERSRNENDKQLLSKR